MADTKDIKPRHLEAEGQMDYDYINDILFFKVKDREYDFSIEFQNMVVDVDEEQFIVGIQIFEASKFLKIGKEHLRKITNIEVLRGNAEKVRGTGLKDGAVDAAVVANILFQIEDKNSFVAEVSRILKPSGWVLVVEWSDSWKGMGPEVSRIVRKEDAKRLFLSVGFSFERDIIAGEHHYGIIFKKN